MYENDDDVNGWRDGVGEEVVRFSRESHTRDLVKSRNDLIFHPSLTYTTTFSSSTTRVDITICPSIPSTGEIRPTCESFCMLELFGGSDVGIDDHEYVAHDGENGKSKRFSLAEILIGNR
jgi:hypothetical protein